MEHTFHFNRTRAGRLRGSAFSLHDLKYNDCILKGMSDLLRSFLIGSKFNVLSVSYKQFHVAVPALKVYCI